MARSTLPFLSAGWVAGLRHKAVLKGEGEEARIKTDQAAVMFGHGRREIAVPAFAATPPRQPWCGDSRRGVAAGSPDRRKPPDALGTSRDGTRSRNNGSADHSYWRCRTMQSRHRRHPRVFLESAVEC